tara:strand:+ start:83 stop:1861 length:1779 start_codon:yes stop_codon:yes gene_type:complete
METFEERIEALTGLSLTSSSNPSQENITTFLTDGAREVSIRISMLKPAESAKFTKTSEDNSNSGIELKGTLISAVREHDSASILRPCEEILPNDRYSATNPSSLKYRSKYNPGYYVLNGKIFCLPISSGSGNNGFLVTQTSMPDVFYNSVDIQDFPTDYVSLVTLYASCKALLSKLGALNGTLPSDLTIPDVPVLPVLDIANFDVVSDTTFALDDNNDLSIDLSFGNVNYDTLADIPQVPVFNKPVFNAPTFPTIENLVLPQPDILTVTPSFTTPDVASVNIVNQVPPIYTAPTISGVAELTGLDQLGTEDLIDVAGESTDFGKWFSTLGHFIEDEEDMELATAQIQKISTYIQAYTAQVQNNFNKFQEQTTAYQNEIQKEIQQAQINAQESQQEANLLLQKENQQYAAELNNYSAKISKYQAEVGAVIQAWQSDEYGVKFNEWTQDYNAKLQVYNVDLQAETARATNDFQLWNTEVQTSLQQFTSEAKADSDAEQTNATTLSANVNKLNANLQRYALETQKTTAANGERIQRYGAEVQTYTTEFGASLQNYQAKIEKIKTEYQWYFGQYQALMSEYNGSFGIQAQKQQGGQ